MNGKAKLCAFLRKIKHTCGVVPENPLTVTLLSRGSPAGAPGPTTELGKWQILRDRGEHVACLVQCLQMRTWSCGEWNDWLSLDKPMNECENQPASSMNELGGFNKPSFTLSILLRAGQHFPKCGLHVTHGYTDVLSYFFFFSQHFVFNSYIFI